MTDANHLMSFRLRAIDIPMLCLMLVPATSAIMTGGGAYLALSETIYRVLGLGVPYLLGRLYFQDEEGHCELSIGIIVGVLIYVPLCLYEIRMSPSLHAIVYGFAQHSFLQTIRFGGYRPMVFMHHGLMVALWLAAGSLLTFILWKSRTLIRAFGIPAPFLFAIIVTTTVLAKSTGALLLLAIAILLYYEARLTKRHWMFLLLCISPLLYVTTRTMDLWHGEGLLEAVKEWSPEREQSLAFRFNSEKRLIQSMGPQFLYGKGPIALTAVTGDEGQRESVVVDSLWIIEFSSNGFLALLSLTLALSVPILAVLRNLGPRATAHGAQSCTFGLSLVALMFLLDCMVNAMVNPVYFIVLGGLAGAGVSRRPPGRA